MTDVILITSEFTSPAGVSNVVADRCGGAMKLNLFEPGYFLENPEMFTLCVAHLLKRVDSR